MPSGAIHPNGSNFSRASRLNVVARVRKLVAQGAYEKRPEWLQFAERAPPLELSNLKIREEKIKSPYFSMIQYVLKKYPDLRFQDCFVDGNDWSVGNDTYRSDHPVMQFVARQLQIMNTNGVDLKAAFEQTSKEFSERRKLIEERHKLDLAIACNQRIIPHSQRHVYPTAAAFAREREAELEILHLNHIRRKLRMLRKEIEPDEKRKMNYKEHALDVELERNMLLPKFVPNVLYAKEDQKHAPNVLNATEESTQKHAPQADLGTPEANLNTTYDTAIIDLNTPKATAEKFRGFNLLPDDLVDDLVEIEPPTFAHLGRKPVELTPDTRVLHARKVSETVLSHVPPKAKMPNVSNRSEYEAQARPDKITVQQILARKQREEIQKRIGKEPGKEELDFEDFMNMVKNTKNK